MQSIIWMIVVILSSALAAPVSAEESTVEEILVTGSHIKRKNQMDSISPMSTIARQDIDATGILTSQELVRWLPENSASENQIDILTASASAGTANVNLRGLGLGSTLVLLNGRRQTVSSAAAQQGDTFVDLNSLVPMIMVDRVEVLTDGASATYGSDTVAGVVNYFTRDTFTGLEVRGDYQATTRSDDQADSEISMIWGGELEGSSLVFAFSHFDRERLQLLERDDLPRMTESSFGAPGSLFLLEPSPTIPDAVVGVFNADPECGRATGSRLVAQANETVEKRCSGERVWMRRCVWRTSHGPPRVRSRRRVHRPMSLRPSTLDYLIE